MTHKTTVDEIKERIQEHLSPSILTVEDESSLHHNHPGAKASGGGHYIVSIVAEQFSQKSLIERHRMVYSALEGLIGGRIHAIRITASTPEEHSLKS